MISQLLRWSLLITIWKKYRRHVTGALGLIIFWLLVSVLHQDYVEYSQLSQPNGDAFAISYLVKWSVNLLGLVGFYFFIRRSRDRVKQRPMEQGKKIKTAESSESDSSLATKDDPFERIRHKKRLRSKGVVLIDESKASK